MLHDGQSIKRISQAISANINQDWHLNFLNSSRHLHFFLGKRKSARSPIKNMQSIRKRLAFAFDFDGVFIQGKNTLPFAKQTLQKLKNLQIPFIILTNGGGMKESLKAQQISDRIRVEITEKQLVLSHSPMKKLAQKYMDQLMLVVGPETCKDVARSYGFKNVISPLEVHNQHPEIWPFKRHLGTSKCLSSLKFGGVLQFHDSLDWGLDYQVMMDVLTCHDGNLMIPTTKLDQTLPIYFSNSDLVWKSSFHSNRFAQGSFRHGFRALFKEFTGKELVYKTFGKPSRDTYQYAHEMLIELASSRDLDIYMIGTETF
jgi:HAD superfamily hydrolase (TIGR01456 family)